MNGQTSPSSCDHLIRANKLCMDLYDIMVLINSSFDVDEIFHTVMEESCKALGCESARIAMREGDNWVIRHVSNLPDDLIGRSFTDEELPHAALAMTTRKPVAIDDAFHDDRTNTKMMESLGIKSVLVLPLMEKAVVTGTLLFGYHSEAVSFTDSEIDYAGKMTAGVAIAIQNARLNQDLEESKRLDEALNEIDTVLYSSQDYDVIMNRMLQLATDVIGAETAVIFSKEGDGWIVQYEYKLPVSLLGQSFSNTEVMHTAITAETKRSIVVQDVLNSPDIDQKFVEMHGIRSLLDFPLILKGEVIGDLTFHYHSGPVPFNERQVEFARKLQISISLALENSRLLGTYKRCESVLKEAEKLGKFGYFNYDVPTRKMTWSEGVFHIFGRDPILGEPGVEELFELYSIDPGLEAMQELVGNKETSEFDAKITRDDLTYCFHFVVRSLKDDKGDLVTFFGTIQDITERKHAEDALQESEERFRATFNQAAVGIGHVLPNGSWLRINQKYCDVVGYSEEELKVLTFNDITHPDDQETSLKHFQLLLEGKLGNYALEKRIIRKDGSPVWVNLTASMVYDVGGNPRFAVSVVEDITKRKQAEEQIKELNVGLAAWTAELDAANKDLEAFNYTVAHDLRQPLNVISMSCQAIIELFGDQIPEECMDYIQGTYNSVAHMNRLIEALLKFSHMGHVDLHREKVSLCVLAHEVFTMLEKSEPERQVDFRVADGITADADANLARVVLDNLLGNAWKYTGMREKAVIEFGTTETDGKPVFFVRDNGTGFDKAAADKLFMPFQRLPGAEEFKGSGIGLATVEQKYGPKGNRARGHAFTSLFQRTEFHPELDLSES